MNNTNAGPTTCEATLWSRGPLWWTFVARHRIWSLVQWNATGERCVARIDPPTLGSRSWNSSWDLEQWDVPEIDSATKFWYGFAHTQLVLAVLSSTFVCCYCWGFLARNHYSSRCSLQKHHGDMRFQTFLFRPLRPWTSFDSLWSVINARLVFFSFSLDQL